MTLVHFSIKNFKRFHNLYGAEESRELYLAANRLSFHACQIQIFPSGSISKFMLVLPGKNKKFAIPLANSIRNEITQLLKRNAADARLPDGGVSRGW